MARIEAASFERFAGACAILTAIASFLYAVAFVILQNVVFSAFLDSGWFALFGCLGRRLLPGARNEHSFRPVGAGAWYRGRPGIGGPRRFRRGQCDKPAEQFRPRRAPSIRGGCSPSESLASRFSSLAG